MNRRKFIKKSGLGLTGISLLSTGNYLFSNSLNNSFKRLLSVQLTDNGKALLNPQMGWTMHFYSNELENYGSKLDPSDTLDDFPGLSTIYFRIPWSFIEMEEGKFNWELLDTPAQRWIDKGMQIALRITTYESWMRFATPEWVKNAGATGKNISWEGTQEEGMWRPDFCDPVFIKKLEKFIAVMAERYDDNPNVAFVDIGSLGVWGEGHSTGDSMFCTIEEGQKKHIDLHCKYFKNTLLCINDDYAFNTDNEKMRFPIMDYAISKGVTLRDDSIMVQPPPDSWYSAGMAQLFWPKFPIILETEHYGISKERNAFSKNLLIESVEDYHASYMSIHWWPRTFLNENKDAINLVNLRMGYRIQLKEISWPGSVNLGEPFTITASLANAGVAPCYPGGYPCITLKDDKQGIVSVLVENNINVRDLQVGKPGEAPLHKIELSFTVAPAYKDPERTFNRNAIPGHYDLYFSIGSLDGTPTIELPYENHDGHKRYKFGVVELRNRNFN